ncbi:MAG: branched-chain amino acid ABC transporter substrate-binding protein, partial [Candidatus Omnitrophica bacterium]|nr:branched-chain amino acid ABC transporter substrate-binding protein [Candidatus Omnitrophota bacterium]
LTRIKPMAPDFIYFGGIYPEGALLIRQARSLGLNAPFMGGDGIATPIFIELASSAIAEGTYSTMVGGDMEKVPAAQNFISAFRSAYGEPGQWSAYGYDAGNILIAAIQKAGVSNREAILKAMRAIPSFSGITGTVTFDALGDNQNQFIGVFQVQSGKLVYIGQAE